jgi:hypothetical protein
MLQDGVQVAGLPGSWRPALVFPGATTESLKRQTRREAGAQNHGPMCFDACNRA